MKKFQFSLDSVQKYKEQNLNIVQMEHAAAENAIIVQQEKIARMEDDFHAANEDLKKKNEIGTSVIELNTVKDYLIKMQESIDKEVIHLAKLQKEAEKVKQRMIDAKVESASIDILKDKRKAEYDVAARKSEDSFIEEIISSKIFRSS